MVSGKVQLLTASTCSTVREGGDPYGSSTLCYTTSVYGRVAMVSVVYLSKQLFPGQIYATELLVFVAHARVGYRIHIHGEVFTCYDKSND